MADESKKIIVDDDWKQQAHKEKEKLQHNDGQARQMPPADFVILVNSFAMQAMILMGVIANPMTGQPEERDLDAARHYIDLLSMLEVKTKGNLTQDETDALALTLHDLRMTFVRISK